MSLNLNPAYVASHWEAVEIGAAKSGRTPDRGDWRMVREVFVADTDAEAMRLSVGCNMGRMMREYFLPLLGQFGFLEYLKHDPSVPDSDVTPEYCAKHNWIVGSPKTVVEKIEKIYDEVGGFGQLLVFGFDYADNPQGLAALARAAGQGGAAQGAAPQAEDRPSWRRNSPPPRQAASSGACASGPLRDLHARDQGEAALAVGPEDRGLAFADVEPVLAEGVDDVGLVADQDDVGAGRRRRRCQRAQGGHPAVVLVRRDDEPALGEVGRRRHLAEAQQGAGLDGALELAGLDLADGNLQRAKRVAHRLGRGAARIVELALVSRILRVERIGIGLIGIGRAMAHDDDVAAVAQRGNPGGSRRRRLGQRGHNPQESEEAGETKAMQQHEHFSSKAAENRRTSLFCQPAWRFDSSAAAANPIAAISMMPARPHNTGV